MGSKALVPSAGVKLVELGDRNTVFFARGRRPGARVEIISDGRARDGDNSLIRGCMRLSMHLDKSDFTEADRCIARQANTLFKIVRLSLPARCARGLDEPVCRALCAVDGLPQSSFRQKTLRLRASPHLQIDSVYMLTTCCIGGASHA